MIEHDGYYYFLKPVTGVYGKIRWSVIKRPVSIAQIVKGGKVHNVATNRGQKALAVSANATPEDEVLASGLTTEEADNFLKLLRS